MAQPARLTGLPCLVLRLSAALGCLGTFALAPALRAGDILRGGAPPAGSRNPGSASAASAAQAAEARSRAQDTLARTTQALNAVKNMQAAARSLSAGRTNAGADPTNPGFTLPNVPDGLGAGGLQVDPRVAGTPSLWTGADLPTQTFSSGKVNVTVKQRQQQAFLNWETFNVGRNTNLHFDQSDGGTSVGQWIAFNQVNDPSGRPSQILGSITAPGQVYVINQNGIIFGGESQINVHTLVASALPINQNLINRGLLNQAKTAQFLFSALPQAGEETFTPPAAPASGKYGDVTVLPGAILSAPTSEANVGGRIALVGANVSNQGSILTPDGQTILAAGLQVGFAAHSSSDASLRGLDAYVGAVADYAGSSSNSGFIEALRGNVTITGRKVAHTGAIESSTSVSLNGRIDLKADYDAVANTNYDGAQADIRPPFLYGGGPSGKGTGSVTLGQGSIIRILPELASADKVIGTELALKSSVNLRGKTIHMDTGAMIQAPSGNITADAGVWDYAAVSSPSTSFVRSGGQIYVGRDALLDVSGTQDAASPLSNWIQTITLRSAELADAPLLRNNPLIRGQSITVDLRKTGTYNGRTWVGTPLANLSGYLGIVERTVGELTVKGGNVSLNSGGSIVVQEGAVIDASAGWLNYGSGTVRTTRLWYGGRLFEIADATPDRLYQGIYTGEFKELHPTWGITHTYRVPWMTGEHFEEGYLHGADAGRIAFAGSSMAVDGSLIAKAISGPRQDKIPAKGGTLDYSFEVQKVEPGLTADPLISPTPPSVVFEERRRTPAGPFAVDAAGEPLPLSADRTATFSIAPSLFTDAGFASLRVRNPDGAITVPANVALEAPALGSVTLEGANVRVLGSISAPGGSLSFAAYNISPSVAAALQLTPATSTLPSPDPNRGQFVLGPGASLDVSGLVIDQRYVLSPTLRLPQVTDGGSVSIRTFSADLAAGSSIDVSGGVLATTRGAFNYGKGGSIEILTGRDLTLSGVTGGKLNLGADLRGFSGSTGGSLSLQAQLIQVGGFNPHPLALNLDPDFFNRGGFSSFSLTGIGLPGEEGETNAAVTIAPGTRIEPRALGWLAIPWGREGSVELELEPFLRPEGLRSPVSLSFNALGISDEFRSLILSRGDIRMGHGASILTDALGSISFKGDTISILGSLIAPGGTISLAGAPRFPSNNATPPTALPTVYLGSSAYLSTAGRTITFTHPRGWTRGNVYAGGSISLSGNIVAEAGSILDVSGTTGVLDLSPAYLSVGNRALNTLHGVDYVPVRLDSNAGSIRLAGGEMLYSDARLIGNRGGPSAQGGSLSVSSGRFYLAGAARATSDTNLVVKQDGSVLAGAQPGRGIGIPLLAADGTPLPGIGNFAVSTFSSGGFDSLSLGGNLEFRGPVSITAAGRIQAATGGVIRADDAVRLAAPYVALGQVFQNPVIAGQEPFIFTRTDEAGQTAQYFLQPQWGNGSLTVIADTIDIGNLALQGIGLADFRAPRGDIRGNGTLSMAGNLRLTAGQIYPTTAGKFNVFAYDYNPGSGPVQGSITISGGDYRDLPLSGGGTLGMYASSIHQGGTLRAPIGVINLGWDGTGTAPVNGIAGTSIAAPVTSQLTLADGSVTSVSAVDPRTGQGILIPYGISLDGISWMDPAGNDITVGGLPAKAVNLSAQNLVTSDTSVIDVRGGGDLFAYRWVPGNGGTQDILASTTSFAVIPGYNFGYAPFAPFGGSASLGGALGYVNSSLRPGDTIYLGSGAGLRAGAYTLLPARYALYPGAFLVTPKAGDPVGSYGLPDGSSIVSGYRYNDLDANRHGVTRMARFEVAPASVVLTRGEYQTYSANTFLKEAAIAREFAVPRLPVDSGYLSLAASASMVFRGNVLSTASSGGRGSLVDISSSSNILINSTGTGGPAGTLVLGAGQLNSIGAESLLIGGQRRLTTSGANVAVNAGSITVDNAGTPLTGSDIILASRQGLTVTGGSEIRGTGSLASADTLFLGSAGTPGSGDGTLLRASAAGNAAIVRTGVTSSAVPSMTVGAGAMIGGGSIILDSTAGTSLDPLARLDAETVTLNSGQISIALANAGTLNPSTGLVLAGDALASLQSSASRLSLLSYSSLDIYGNGTLGSREDFDSLSLTASTIRGYNTGAGTAAIAARNILINNSTGRAALALPGGPLQGSLSFTADEIRLGTGTVQTGGYADLLMNAASRIIAEGTGLFGNAGNLTASTPLLTAERAAVHGISAGGSLNLLRPAGAVAGTAGGLGARLNLSGAAVSLNSDVLLPSGELTATARTGDLRIGDLAAAQISTAGTASRFIDVNRFTDGGVIRLTANAGSVSIGSGGAVSVAGAASGGNAGSLSVSAPMGGFSLAGSISGSAAAGYRTGSFTQDTSTAGTLAGLNATLNTGSFNESRDFRVRTGDVLIDGTANARNFSVAADNGSIRVTGTINASGVTGGTINLISSGSLTLESGSMLSVAGQSFSAAGKGGAISLQAGAHRAGVVDGTAMLNLLPGSSINLSVAEANAQSAARGQFTGTLHLRAPRNAAQTDLALGSLGSTITGASSILAEGYRLYDLTASAGTITSAVQTSIGNDAAAFLGSSGTASAAYTAMLSRLLGADPQGLAPVFVLAPGAEIINRTGGLTLGTSNSTPTSDWNLQNFRYGPRSAPGVLTLRSSGDLTFFNTLSDGFAAVTANANNGNSALWLAPLMAQNALLPVNTQSWTYRLTAGADFSAAAPLTVMPRADGAAGYLNLGKNATATIATGGNNALTSSLIRNNWQVIRTGSGNIDIAAAQSVRLLNPFAAIYTAGTQVASPTAVHSAGDFVVPILNPSSNPAQGSLGAAQQAYFAQYSMAGGNVSISAGGDIERLTRTTLGDLVPDSSRQTPTQWLYRRGYVDPATGEWGATGLGSGFFSFTDNSSSLSWWVDYSNFFQSVGALGGGNVNLAAAGSISNIDAVAPTNARAPSGAVDASRILELGGGDISVRAGSNIDAGIYYVERGTGTLSAGGSIITNSTRSPSRNYITSTINPEVFPEQTWLPTTLFAGKGSFDVSARGDVLLAPTTNPFLLPAGLGNKFWNKTYFSTYSPDTSISISSLGGNVTLRNEIVLPNGNSAHSILQTWMEKENLLTTGNTGAAFTQPWLRLAETRIDPFNSVLSLAPPSLNVTTHSGNINVVGSMTLAPSATGNLQMLAAGSINALQPAGESTLPVPGQSVNVWTAGRINVSDANPAALPGLSSPLSYFSVSGRTANLANTTSAGFLQGVDSLFAETGSTGGVIQVKQALHTAGLLHAADSELLRLYALGGNISGLTLFAPKPAAVHASRDLTDIAFYLQNLDKLDATNITAGRDIVPYNASSPLRAAAAAAGNVISSGQTPLAGDLQIAGPGTLNVLAGRTIDLGTGASNLDGTGAGIVSIGNARNPYLAFEGANLLVGAGLGPVTSLTGSSLDFDSFISTYVKGGEGATLLAEIAPGVDFDTLPSEEQRRIALGVFYGILRNAGRNFATTGNYETGFAAIDSLFGAAGTEGEVKTQGRSIRTASGGDISIFAPGGGLTLANTQIGNPLVPPGIITESGGKVSIFTKGDVDIGIGRIFTLRGGDMVIWSSEGNIAAGTSSKTVASAPPTRVLIDPQSADVTTDLAGLATGGGIGVLATVKNVPPGNVDLVAPTGIIDAGDAGIRVSGNITLAATQVVNASNIAATGSSTGAPAVAAPAAPAAPSAPPPPQPTTAAPKTTADPGKTSEQVTRPEPVMEVPPSEITVKVIGYGGGDGSDSEPSSMDDEEKKRRRQLEQEQSGQPAEGTSATPGQ